MPLTSRDIEEELRQLMMGIGDQPDLALDVGAEKARLAQLGAGMTDGMGEDLPRGTKVNFAADLETKAPESAAARTPIVPKVVEVPGTPADDFELAAARVEDRQARAREAFERGSRELVGGLTRTQAAPAFKQPQDAEAKLLATRDRRTQDAQRNETNRATAAKFNFERAEAARKAAIDAERDRRDFEYRRAEGDESQELRRQGIDASNANAAAMRSLAGAQFGFRKDEAAATRKGQAADDLANLRKEFNSLPDVKTFGEVDASYRKVRDAASNPSAAGDLGLIFAYMKMLDPGSSVREGEFANAQNAGGIDAKIQSAWNNALRGERLTPEQRADFIAQAKGLFDVHKSRYDAQVTRYRGLASKQDANPDDVTGATATPAAGGGLVVLVDENGEELDVSPDKVDAILKKHPNLRRK